MSSNSNVALCIYLELHTFALYILNSRKINTPCKFLMLSTSVFENEISPNKCRHLCFGNLNSHFSIIQMPKINIFLY